MGRIRSIKPEYWTSETIAALSLPTRLTFIGLWNYCDDHGVGRLNERLITAALYPMDDPLESLERVSRGISELSDAGRIALYEVDGRRYFHVTTWSEHQRVDNPGKSKLPKPDHPDAKPLTSPLCDPRESLARNPESDPTSYRLLESSSPLEQGAGSRDQGAEERGNEGAKPSSEIVVATPRSDVESLCQHLADRIEANGAKRPAVTAKWRDAARLMLDKDGRSYEQVRACIDWCQSDEFWRANILAMPTLRTKYDQLRLAAQRTGSNGNGRAPHHSDPAYWDRAEARIRTRMEAM